MKVLILAGGLGTRLYKYTNGLYPKILLSLGNELFLDKLINYWFEIMNVSKMTIVVSDLDYKNILSEYITITYPELSINILVYEKTNGTYNTLKHINLMYPGLINDSFVSWSDIIPTEKLPEPDTKFNDITTIYTDRIKRHRYNVSSTREGQVINIARNMDGNIPGLYYIRDIFNLFSLPNNKLDNKETDLIEFIKYVSMTTYYDVDIIDIGDEKKYENYISNIDISNRWFNDISFTKDTVLKRSKSEFGDAVLTNEINFYKYIKGTDLEKAFPKVYSFENNSILMENLETQGYKTVNEHIIMDPTSKVSILNDYLKFTNSIGNEKKEPIKSHIYHEYINVTAIRYAKIKHIIPVFDEVIINNRLFDTSTDFYNVLDRLEKYFKNNYTTYFEIIHGDPNTTNVLYRDYDKSFKYIDPRGVFGTNLYYGDKKYDIAKFVYGLCGYSNFNLDKLFTFTIGKNGIKIDLEELDLLFDLDIDNDIKILVGLIWLKLPYYIKNNPNKSIASYYIGIAIINKYLKNI